MWVPVCMFEAAPAIRLKLIVGAVLAAGGLAGCTAPSPAAVPPPLAALPGPGKTPAAFRQDDAACRAAAAAEAQQTAEQLATARSGVVLATEAGAGPVGASSTPPPSTAVPPNMAPGMTYARCMTSRHNQVQQIAPAMQPYADLPSHGTPSEPS